MYFCEKCLYIINERGHCKCGIPTLDDDDKEYKVTKSGKSYYTVGNVIYPYFGFVGDK